MAKIIYQTMPGGRKKAGKKRVAAYARISCVKDAMLHSLSAQVSYFSNLIQRNPDWIFAGICRFCNSQACPHGDRWVVPHFCYGRDTAGILRK